MTERRSHHPEDPEREVLRAWLTHLTRQYIHTVGWEEVNNNFHNLATRARTFANTHYVTPEEREAFLDGQTFGLLGLIHDGDIKDLTERLSPDEGTAPAIPQQARTNGESVAGEDQQLAV